MKKLWFILAIVVVPTVVRGQGSDRCAEYEYRGVNLALEQNFSEARTSFYNAMDCYLLERREDTLRVSSFIKVCEAMMAVDDSDYVRAEHLLAVLDKHDAEYLGVDLTKVLPQVIELRLRKEMEAERVHDTVYLFSRRSLSFDVSLGVIFPFEEIEGDNTVAYYSGRPGTSLLSSGSGLCLSLGANYYLWESHYLQLGLMFARYKDVQQVYAYKPQEVAQDEGGTLRYQFKNMEKLTFNTLMVPLTLNISLWEAVELSVGGYMEIGLAANCKIDGWLDYNSVNSAGQSGTFYSSEYTEKFNLYSGKYELRQQYIDGSDAVYTYNGWFNPPYERVTAGLCLGLKIGFFQVSYYFGFQDIANADYWYNTYKNQLPGQLIRGQQTLYNVSNEQEGHRRVNSYLMMSYFIRFGAGRK